MSHLVGLVLFLGAFGIIGAGLAMVVFTDHTVGGWVVFGLGLVVLSAIRTCA